ncbi:MAG: hypothetical protein ACFFC1_19160 [Promethearchaeota archaeon]
MFDILVLEEIFYFTLPVFSPSFATKTAAPISSMIYDICVGSAFFTGWFYDHLPNIK